MKIPPSLVSWVIAPLYRLWCSTLIFTESGRDRVDTMNTNKDLMVFCCWHNEVSPVMYAKRNLRIVAIVSRSTDGEYLARLLQSFDMKTARGSSSRGGLAALKQTASLMTSQDYNACITIDGPRGPRHVPKPGAIFLAQHTNAAIVPMRIFMKRAKIFNSWDRFRLPLPFSRVHVAFGTPYYIDNADSSEKAIQVACDDLKNRLVGMQPPEKRFLDDAK